MGPTDFFTQLKQLGYEIAVSGQYAIFTFTVPIGSRIGAQVKLALFATPDYPLSAPPGPHVSPRIEHPRGANHNSDLGPDWVYWSRPFPDWPRSSRDARAYMSHVRRLFEQL